MEFTNVVFLFLVLPIFLISYYLVKDKYKNLVIVLTSFLMLYWEFSDILLKIICFSLFNYGVSYFMTKTRMKAIQTVILVITICLNFVALFIIDYYIVCGICCNHFINMNKYFMFVWISVFSMNSISYIVDIYKKRVEFSKNIINYFVYMFMFYKFYFGPPIPYYKLKNTIEKRIVTIDMVVEGVENFILGLSKISIFTYEIGQVKRFVILKFDDIISSKTDGLPVITAWIGLFSMFFYVYFYFSGYFDIITGLGKITGFKILNNVGNKIFYNSLTQFFQNFNILFTNYFKFYVFPWIRARGKIFKFFKCFVMYVLYMICFFNFNFVSYFFMLVLLEKLFLNKIFANIPQYLKKIYCFIFILIGFGFIFMDSFGEMLLYIKFLLFGGSVFLDKSLIFVAVFFRFFAVLSCFYILKLILKWLQRKQDKLLKLKVIINYVFHLALFLFSICYCLTF